MGENATQPMTEHAADSLVDQLLVLRCQTGDEAAFAELVGRYHRRLRYYLQKMLDAQRVDDALQELWLDVFRSIGKLKEPRAFSAWVYRLARDRAYRNLRRAEDRTRDLAQLDLPDVADVAFCAEDAEEIHQSLGQLNPEHREVLLLRFVEDMSYDQIADVVGCELGTVRSRLHYAKQKLKELIQQRNHYEPERFSRRTAQAGR
jgi:RNA polymerase sigma-70 factor, ECF subfamily